MTDIFSATDSLKGYIYQIRYALLIALQEEISEIAIEKFDDVSVEDVNDVRKMYQLKHHRKGNLTNSSTDLWKTIRIWSKQINDGNIDTSDGGTKFFIITTQNAAEESIAYKMTRRGSKDKDISHIQHIVEELDNITAKSSNEENKSSYDEYNSLTDENKMKLVEMIEVIDNVPTIDKLDEKIIKEIRYSCSIKNRRPFFDRLESWWYKQAIEHLITPNLEPIKKESLLNRIDDLRESFSTDNLPIDFADSIDIDATFYQNHNFVKQLQLLKPTRKNRVVNAINDYYKAYHQRTRWGKDNLVSVEELYEYEKKLLNEWERAFDAILDEMADEDDDLKCGRRIYKWMEIEAKIHLREKCTESFVMRGSYHMLANELKVGWHPNFAKLLNKIEEGELA